MVSFSYMLLTRSVHTHTKKDRGRKKEKKGKKIILKMLNSMDI